MIHFTPLTNNISSHLIAIFRMLREPAVGNSMSYVGVCSYISNLSLYQHYKKPTLKADAGFPQLGIPKIGAFYHFFFIPFLVGLY
jgi:hypothetical protein